ncbi:DUF3224 domain-containing protein [Streptomyces sp. ISL-86]|uniref:DUF3224 domain-containing protein n=1 Tax=Streptomyces sp. ISL-86 TaxID=2819187 RepID=UPI001BEA55F2|nr:DUF3224 domain-containing protein [Streptomyces sp. ISL-86]MBT2457784.1 DUF3224 domain-containing protein [Streptomyces sp. ISL-86]
MPTTTPTSGSFTYANWEEHPIGPADTTPRLARATVANTFSGGIEAAETACEYTITYTGEHVGTFAGMELLSGTVDGRKGTFVLEERGTFDATGATHCRFEVVPGSATGELTGLSGSGSFTARQGEPSVGYVFTYDYELA